MANQFTIEGATLPSRYCVKPVIAPGPMHDKILAALRRYFSAYEIPELEEGVWGWPDDRRVMFGDAAHVKIVSAASSIPDASWAKDFLESLLVTDGSASSVEDLLAYSRWQKEHLANLRSEVTDSNAGEADEDWPEESSADSAADGTTSLRSEGEGDYIEVGSFDALAAIRMSKRNEHLLSISEESGSGEGEA